ncbi:MAG TPA: amidase, partial [Gaiellales bacterium]|nr:amidase [Gaiellales bacterium]
MNGLLDAPGWEISAAVRARRVSATEVAKEALERVRADSWGAVWLVTEERALREAAAIDAALARGDAPDEQLLLGVPVGWKDLIDTAGDRTTYGSALYRDNVPARDAEAVERLAAAGAITVAKLATHELAWGTTTQNPHFGSCRNPHDPTRVPGGSSGGSGAALATAMVAAAPGTDTGGSIRCPASCCGIVGLKPTYGRVSLAGVRPLCTTLDHCGPM